MHADIMTSWAVRFTGSRVSNPKKICQIWSLLSRYWLIWWDAVVMEELENSPLVLDVEVRWSRGVWWAVEVG